MSSTDFSRRHIGPGEADIPKMLKKTGVKSMDELIRKTIPSSILSEQPLKLQDGMSEQEYLDYIRAIGAKNKLFKNYLGSGYYDTLLPPVIQRNILENPGWYTSYTPYQAEISQGRLEALLNFQTMIMELTGMEIANASLLDEPTAAAEAMIMMFNVRSREMVNKGVNKFFADRNMFPQILDLLKTRSKPLNIELVIDDYRNLRLNGDFFGVILQYPAADGKVINYSRFLESASSQQILTCVVADLLTLALLKPPGEWNADIVVGSAQRFGLPLGYGGPHTGYFATKETFKRSIPGRIIGISIDRYGKPALRMALQTREQHIRREKATSNICTAQALLAIMAGMYAAWHGPDGLKNIAKRIHSLTTILAGKLLEIGYTQDNPEFFDTIHIRLPQMIHSEYIMKLSRERKINFYYPEDNGVRISLDETTTLSDVKDILEIFAVPVGRKYSSIEFDIDRSSINKENLRTSDFMKQQVFNRYHSETEMMRYIKKLERRDFSLTHSMISLGSCTMKLNAAVEMLPLSWPEFANLHPFVPIDQAEGYQELINDLGKDLKIITGFNEISFMPNSGAAGEYAGLLVIRAYHENRNEKHRNVCLIPASAHGTNPASAVMAGMQVVVVECDEKGNVNVDRLKTLAEEHRSDLAAFMITYPSTHGVFEEQIREMVKIIHDCGGQVYMDGANMNAQVGLTNPALIGADVCHLNLHKTFAIPHGGGGPGMGPIAVAEHLVEFLPTHPMAETGGIKGITAVSGSPWGSALILTISHAYVKLMGGKGLTEATRIAILNANYLAASLNEYYHVLYAGKSGFVGHEMILDCRNFRQVAGITEADIAKRLMDYGFHAPTLSFPVHGTLMVEPTESESLYELDRFTEAMISIYREIMEIKEGKADPVDNVLKNAPHTAEEIASGSWTHPYSREKAAFPLPWIAENKFWPSVGRIDDAYGDRNLLCSCEPIEEYNKKHGAWGMGHGERS
jgi:glycine dehydrogenase